MSSPKPFYQVDAFTSKAFAGNPAAVVLLDSPMPEEWMQKLAMENNLAETAYLVPQEEGYGLRWFTPETEVDLCGHATLASAHALWEAGKLPHDTQARFHTKSGLLTADYDAGWITLDFPATPASPITPPEGLLEALGTEAVSVHKSRFDYLVEVASESIVRGLTPDHRLLKPLSVRGIMVTSKSDTAEFDFVSRFFAPGVGIEEDPATGSMHCCLTPFWAERLGKTEMVAYQASKRGGVLQLRLVGERVHLRGQAVMVLRGEVLV